LSIYHRAMAARRRALTPRCRRRRRRVNGVRLINLEDLHDNVAAEPLTPRGSGDRDGHWCARKHSGTSAHSAHSAGRRRIPAARRGDLFARVDSLRAVQAASPIGKLWHRTTSGTAPTGRQADRGGACHGRRWATSPASRISVIYFRYGRRRRPNLKGTSKVDQR
jgi:hypothetical protein